MSNKKKMEVLYFVEQRNLLQVVWHLKYYILIISGIFL